MEIINIDCSKPYSVYVGKDIIEKLLPKFCNGKTCFVCDTNIYNLYFSNKKFPFDIFIINGGEGSKSYEESLKLLTFLADNKYSRSDKLIAFGGGVVGDLTGFVSAIYMRGIDYVQVPTSLLAMIDSAIGGKTAVNLKQAKNVVGAFKSPISVIVDTNFLETLPLSELQNGFGEIIKYAILDKTVFNLIKMQSFESLVSNEKLLKNLIVASINVKKYFIEIDEFDCGERMKLNLGHTFGHCIEKEYGIPHGIAVINGIKIALEISKKLSLFSGKIEVFNKLLNLIKINNVDIESNKIIEKIQLDKKVIDEKINLILIKDIGICEIVKFEINNIEELISE